MTNTKPAGDNSPPSLPRAPATGEGGQAARVQLRAGTPDAVLAVVPHLLGFYPSRSLVVLGLGEQDRVVVTFRYDLPEDRVDEVASDIAEHASFVLSRERLTAAVLVGYGPDDLAAPVIGAAAARLLRDGVLLREVLRADGGRFWSKMCSDPACCPPAGRPYDPGSHPAAAALAAAGLPAQPDRAALARTLQRPAGTASLIASATSQALLRLAQLVALGEALGDRDPEMRATRAGRKEMQRAIRRYRAGATIDSIDHLAWLAVLLGDMRVRDDAWARMDPVYREQHGRLWTDVLRCAALDYAPAPASLLAFTAWQSGNGALASMAIDRALGADPGYSMAKLLAGAIEAALPPSAARLPMTPAAVAASYGGTAPAGRGAVPARPGRTPSGAGRGSRAAGGDSRRGSRAAGGDSRSGSRAAGGDSRSGSRGAGGDSRRSARAGSRAGTARRPGGGTRKRIAG